MARIGWVLVNYGPIWSPAYTTHLIAAAHASRTLEIEMLGQIGTVAATDRMYTHQAENQGVQATLLDNHCTHIFMTENDMLLPKDCVLPLLALDKPVASGLYFLRQGDGQPCLYQRSLAPVGDDYSMSPVSLFPTEQPFRLNGCCGLGCVLIRREVFEQLDMPWFDLSYGRYGSDMYFYTRLRRAGIDVWVDPRVRCDQIEYKVWSFADYEERLKADPKFPSSGTLIGVPAL